MAPDFHVTVAWVPSVPELRDLPLSELRGEKLYSDDSPAGTAGLILTAAASLTAKVDG